MIVPLAHCHGQTRQRWQSNSGEKGSGRERRGGKGSGRERRVTPRPDSVTRGRSTGVYSSHCPPRQAGKNMKQGKKKTHTHTRPITSRITAITGRGWARSAETTGWRACGRPNRRTERPGVLPSLATSALLLSRGSNCILNINGSYLSFNLFSYRAIINMVNRRHAQEY